MSEIFDVIEIEDGYIIRNCPDCRSDGDIEQKGACLAGLGDYYCMGINDCLTKKAYKKLRTALSDKEKLVKALEEIKAITVYTMHTPVDMPRCVKKIKETCSQALSEVIEPQTLEDVYAVFPYCNPNLTKQEKTDD